MNDDTGSPRRPTRRTIILVAAAAAILLAGASLAVTSQPAVCASCHAMRPFADALRTTPHAGTDCYTCHLAAGAWSWPTFKSRELLVMYPSALRGGAPTGAGSRSAGRRCLECHGGVMRRTVQADGLRISHKDCVPEGSCDACHDSVAHGSATRWERRAVMEDCLRCHIERGPIDCGTCHTRRDRSTLLKKSAWRVTHGPGWKAQHGMGDIRLCRTCHEDSTCISCHGLPVPHPAEFGRTHGEYSRSHSATCAACHDGRGFCDECHGVTMPHPAGFVRLHGATAVSRSDKRCLRCHYAADCETCHASHKHPADTGGGMDGTLLPGVRRP